MCNSLEDKCRGGPSFGHTSRAFYAVVLTKGMHVRGGEEHDCISNL